MKRKIYTFVLFILLTLSMSQPFQIIRFYSGLNTGIVFMEFFGVDNEGIYSCPAVLEDNHLYINPFLPVIPESLIVDC